MRRFIIKTLLFSLPVLLLLIAMEILLRMIPNDYQAKKKYLDNHSKEIETLILGSSHSLFGIDPQYLSKNAYNASYVSQSLDYDFEILRKYQAKLINLKTIILPISYFTLYSKLATGDESWRIKNYVIYYDINVTKSLSYHFEILSSSFIVNLTRLDSYYLKGVPNISCTELGWGTSFKSEESMDLIATGKEAALRHTNGNAEIFEENIAILKSMIGLCESKKINVLLFTPPSFETYRQNINTEQLKKTVDAAGELAKEYSNCHYINLFESAEFKANEYYDADHVNEIGAKKLSMMINDRIKDWK